MEKTISNTRQRFGYGAADMASNLVWPMIITYLSVYYTDVAKISLAAVGIIMLLSKFVDACTDIIMGVVVDHTRTRWGKCRPFLLFGAIPLAITAVLTFYIPEFDSMTKKIVYAFIAFNLVSTAYTVVNTPLSALLASISDDEHERNVLVTFRMVMAAIGSFCVTTFASPLISKFGGNSSASSYGLTVAVFSFVAILLLLFSFSSTRESQRSIESAKVSFKDALKAINGQYILFIFIMFVFMLGFATKQAGLVYYYTYVVENTAIIPIQAAVTSVSMIASQIAIPFFARKLGKKKSMYLMSGIALAGNALFLFGGTGIVSIILGTVLVWYALGFMMGMRFSLLADVVDYCEAKSGVQASGILCALDSFIAKLTFGLNLTIFTWLMSLGGYVPNAVQSSEEKNLITFGFIGIPSICVVLTVILLLFFNIKSDKKA